jgi:hypothetical protein
VGKGKGDGMEEDEGSDVEMEFEDAVEEIEMVT